MPPVTNDQVLRNMALAYPETQEAQHFEKTSFRVKRKIFVTYDSKSNLACIKLSEAMQEIFSVMAPDVVYPVPNKWGKQGCTFIDLSEAPPALVADALRMAYIAVAPKCLSEVYRDRPKNQ